MDSAQQPQAAPSPYATRKIDHELDPKGDTILVLQPSTAPFAVWMHGNEWPNALDQSSTANNAEGQQSATTAGGAQGANDQPPTDQAEDEQEDYEPAEVLFRVSSRHLILASDYFQKLFEGPWKESGTPTFASPRILIVEEWREEAMLTVMNIIHGRFRKVPKKVTSEFAAEVCVLVDYYQCQEAMEMHSDRWIPQLPRLPDAYSRELVLDLFISIVFREMEQVKKLSRAVVAQCRGPMQTLGLPIPSSTVDYMDELRQNNIRDLLDHTYSQFKRFNNGDFICSEEHCDDALLGCFTKMLLSGGLLFRQPEKPYYGYSWNELADHMEAATLPGIHKTGPDPRCSVNKLLKPKIDQVELSVNNVDVQKSLGGGSPSRESHFTMFLIFQP